MLQYTPSRLESTTSNLVSGHLPAVLLLCGGDYTDISMHLHVAVTHRIQTLNQQEHNLAKTQNDLLLTSGHWPFLFDCSGIFSLPADAPD